MKNIVKAQCDMVVYKKGIDHCNVYLITLIIPKGTLYHRSLDECEYTESVRYDNIHNRKCRAEYAYVASITNIAENKTFKKYVNDPNYNISIPHYLIYEVDKMVYPDYFSKKDLICDAGIHFFLDPQDAICYDM